MFKSILRLLAVLVYFSRLDAEVQLPLRANESLVDPAFIAAQLTHQAPWCHLHGASRGDLGVGMFYYALAYAAKANLCVCLGSGDGFVPRVMRQAQRDLRLQAAKTILIDGNMGSWGRPFWQLPSAFLHSAYPEITIIIDSTYHAARSIEVKKWEIDYLHIDADRTTYGALQDFLDYLPLMQREGIITLHDVGAGRPCSKTVDLIRAMGYEVVVFNHFGTGLALITLSSFSDQLR